MASNTETERLEKAIAPREAYSLKPILDELTRTYSGDPLFLVELKEFIDTFSGEDMAIIYLRYYGFDIEEISRELGKSRRRIEQRIKKIKEESYIWIG
ncbi:sigma-70 family RNA polymerase sigma factor [bacterium]|nr:sigma-70 family RNA polymerase sigma factor [bacterium]